jgi:hypothetical protein
MDSVDAFGFWSVADRSTPYKVQVEDGLASVLDFYETSIEQAHWYGFWDYGDVMHSYDSRRHVWNYDLGGMAWDNSELGTDMWLWYSFLRTGDKGVWTMARAMTRHTGEVDTYHFGPMAGLGSRHNVRHWGCGAKEARIGQAAYRRFMYYLTTDERTGDVMHETLQADKSVITYDPMRIARPPTEAESQYPTRVRLGPDWFALVSNWFTEYERTLDPKWMAKIDAGIDSVVEMPLGLRTGRDLVMGFDPDTGRLYQLDNVAGTYNLSTIMGGAEFVMDMNQDIERQDWQDAWLQFCRLYGAPKEVVLQERQGGAKVIDARYPRDSRMAAYLYMKIGEDAFGERAVQGLRAGRGRRDSGTLTGPLVLNPIVEGPAGTNGAAQNSLETIAVLGMAADKLPVEPPPPGEGRGGRPRGGRGG